MKTLSHVTDIPATADEVWRVLMDVDAYAEWNPFMTIDTAPSAVGERLTITARAGKRAMTFHPTVTVFEPGREVTWRGRSRIPGCYEGVHTLALEPLPDGRTRFCHSEVFRGFLIPFMRSALRDTDVGLASMNAALANRVHTLLATG